MFSKDIFVKDIASRHCVVKVKVKPMRRVGSGMTYAVFLATEPL